jgi:hypothetical protein
MRPPAREPAPAIGYPVLARRSTTLASWDSFRGERREEVAEKDSAVPTFHWLQFYSAPSLALGQ